MQNCQGHRAKEVCFFQDQLQYISGHTVAGPLRGHTKWKKKKQGPTKIRAVVRGQRLGCDKVETDKSCGDEVGNPHPNGVFPRRMLSTSRLCSH